MVAAVTSGAPLACRRGALRNRPVMARSAKREMRVPMLGTARVRALVAVSAMLLLATACTGGDGGGGTAVTESPTVAPATAAGASPTTRELPASLASAKGWLAYSTFIGDEDRIHLARVDGSEDHQAFTELPGDVIRADFSRNGQLAFEYRPPNDAYNVYVANADGTGARVVAKCKVDECERDFPPGHLTANTWRPTPPSVNRPLTARRQSSPSASLT